MEKTATPLKVGLTIGWSLLVVLVAVPLLAVIAIVLRPLALGLAALAAVACAVAFALSRRFRSWLGIRAAGRWTYKGLELPAGLAMHPGHSWAREDGDVVVGADDLVQAVLGPVDTVDLPATGQHVGRGDRLFTLRRGTRSVTLRAPLSGTVLATNTALGERPALVNQDPFGRGWAVRLRPSNLRQDGRHLLWGRRARAWLQEEIDRLMHILAPREAEATLPDGGTLAAELHRHIDDEAWSRLGETIFGAPDS